MLSKLLYMTLDSDFDSTTRPSPLEVVVLPLPGESLPSWPGPQTVSGGSHSPTARCRNPAGMRRCNGCVGTCLFVWDWLDIDFKFWIGSWLQMGERPSSTGFWGFGMPNFQTTKISLQGLPSFSSANRVESGFEAGMAGTRSWPNTPPKKCMCPAPIVCLCCVDVS